jgi:hypothetical protein
MEPEGSLPRLQVPATCPYAEPEQYCPHPPSLIKVHFNIITKCKCVRILKIQFIPRRSEVKCKVNWRELSYGEVIADKGAMYSRVNLYGGYLIILSLFHLEISCTVFVLICTVVVLYSFVMCVCVCVCVYVCVCVDFVMCGCFGNMYTVLWGFTYPNWDFSVHFPQLQGKCQDKSRKDGARPALFQIICYLCCSVVICVVLLFYILFMCKCVLYYCHLVSIQLQLTNILYQKLLVAPYEDQPVNAV